MKTRRLFVVDDDAELRSMLARYLESHGFEVLTFADGDSAQNRMQRLPADLMVLDLMMPGKDGLSVCRELRAAGERIPIVMLTARAEPIDRIVGLELGADDYVAKPFEPRELLARINAVLRRKAPNPATPLADEPLRRVGDATFDLGRRTLLRGDITVRLSSAEYALLAALTSHPFVPLSRERLLELSRGKDRELFDRAIDVAIHRLRKLLEQDAGSPLLIQTVRHVGYVYVPSEG